MKEKSRKKLFQSLLIRVTKTLPPDNNQQVLCYNQRYKSFHVLPSWLARRDAALFLNQMEDPFPFLDLSDTRLFSHWMPCFFPATALPSNMQIRKIRRKRRRKE